MAGKINMFNQIKSFYSIVFNGEIDLKPTHVSLYMFLLNQNNRCNWIEWFKCPFDVAMAGALINSKTTYYKTLDELKRFNLIDYEKGVNHFKAPKIKIINLDSIPKNDTLPVPLSVPLPVPLSVPLPVPLSVPLSGNIIRLITDNYITINDNYEEVEKFILNLSGKKPKIKLTDDLFKGLDEDFAEYIQKCINSRAPIFLKKEIANKKNTYFQLVKNIPTFRSTIGYLRSKETDETLEDCEKRVDKALVDWLKEQTAGKIEHSWDGIPDIAQHALNYIRKQKKLTDERPKSHFGASTNKHTGAIETKSNDYSNSGW